MEYLAYGVRCKKCEQFCTLRYLKSGEEFDCQQVLPMETRPLTFVCIVCGTLSVLSMIHEGRFHRAADQPPATAVIHRMKFACAQDNCGLPIEVYIEAEKRRSSGEELAALLKFCSERILTGTCRDRHPKTVLNRRSFLIDVSVLEVSWPTSASDSSLASHSKHPRD